MLEHRRFNKLKSLLRLNKPEPSEDLEAVITSHANGLIVIQLNEPLQSIFLNDIEACAIAKALLLEARRVRIRRTSNGTHQ